MVVTLDELVRLSRATARLIDPRVYVEGITSADGGTGRAELLITLSGCHSDPCAILLNLHRGDVLSVERELRTKLREVLRLHVAT